MPVIRTNEQIQQNAVCQINLQKSVVSLFTNKESPEKEIRKAILFPTATSSTPEKKTTKQNKNTTLGINLTKEMKALYNKNYKSLMEETEEDTN